MTQFVFDAKIIVTWQSCKYDRAKTLEWLRVGISKNIEDDDGIVRVIIGDKDNDQDPNTKCARCGHERYHHPCSGYSGGYECICTGFVEPTEVKE